MPNKAEIIGIIKSEDPSRIEPIFREPVDFGFNDLMFDLCNNGDDFSEKMQTYVGQFGSAETCKKIFSTIDKTGAGFLHALISNPDPEKAVLFAELLQGKALFGLSWTNFMKLLLVEKDGNNILDLLAGGENERLLNDVLNIVEEGNPDKSKPSKLSAEDRVKSFSEIICKQKNPHSIPFIIKAIIEKHPCADRLFNLYCSVDQQSGDLLRASIMGLPDSDASNFIEFIKKDPRYLGVMLSQFHKINERGGELNLLSLCSLYNAAKMFEFFIDLYKTHKIKIPENSATDKKTMWHYIAAAQSKEILSHLPNMLEALDGDSNNFFLSEDLDSKTACEVLATQQFLRQDPDLLTYLNTILTRKIKEYNKSHTEKFQLACLAKIVITLLYSKSQCGLDRELNFFQIKQAVCNSDIDRFYEIFRKYSNELRIQFEDPEFSPAELEVEFSRIQKIQEDLSSNLNEKQCCEFPNPSGNKYFVINAPISGHKAYIVVECDQGGKPLKLTYIDGNCLARFNGNDEFGYGGLTSIIKDKFMNIGSVLEEIEKYGPISTLNRRDYFNDVEAIIEGVCLLDNMEGSLYTKLQTHQNCVGKSAGLLERFLVQKLHETDEHDAECLVKAHKYAVVEMSATISAGFLANKELQGTKYDLLRSTPDSAVKAAFNHAVFKKARFEERYKEYEQNGGEEPKSKIATLNLQSRVIELMQAPIDRVVRDCLLPQLKSRASLSNIQETIADKDRAESMNLKIFGSGDVANSSSTPPKKKDSQSATSTPESRVKDLPATGGDSSEGIPETPKSNPTGANRFSPTTIFSPCAKVERSPEKVTKLVSASGKIVYYVGSGTVV